MNTDFLTQRRKDTKAQVFAEINSTFAFSASLRLGVKIFIRVHRCSSVVENKFYKTMTIRAGRIWQFEFRNL
jgi:hypothetical protein